MCSPALDPWSIEMEIWGEVNKNNPCSHGGYVLEGGSQTINDK